MPLVLTVGLGAYFVLVTKLSLGPTAAFLLGVLTVFAFSLGYAYVLHLLVEKPALWVRDRVAGDGKR